MRECPKGGKKSSRPGTPTPSAGKGESSKAFSTYVDERISQLEQRLGEMFEGRFEDTIKENIKCHLSKYAKGTDEEEPDFRSP